MLGMVSPGPGPALELEEHRPSSAPTRPSTAPIPVLRSTAGRVPYTSNIRKHRSALEAVVSVPRRRKRARVRRGGGGPLDRVMVSMVGEKEIPLVESEEEDEPSGCKQA